MEKKDRNFASLVFVGHARNELLITTEIEDQLTLRRGLAETNARAAPLCRGQARDNKKRAKAVIAIVISCQTFCKFVQEAEELLAGFDHVTRAHGWKDCIL